MDKVLRERNWSRVRLFEEVGAELGYGPKSRSAFLPLLVDAEPDTKQAAVLARHFGEPDEAEEPPQPNVDPMVAAVDRQTEAIRENTAMLERLLAAVLPTPPDVSPGDSKALRDRAEGGPAPTKLPVGLQEGASM